MLQFNTIFKKRRQKIVSLDTGEKNLTWEQKHKLEVYTVIFQDGYKTITHIKLEQFYHRKVARE